MTQFIVKLIIIALLFTSAEAAICSIHFAAEGDIEVVELDSSEHLDGLIDDGSCTHMCHCAHHFAAFSTGASLVLHSAKSEVNYYTEFYSSKDTPPLFRPPIA
jgi:hypothetical protein